MDNFYSDCQTVYDFLKTRYPEDSITVIGYSLGTALASHLSASNKPKQTILIDPKERFSADIFDRIFPFFPTLNIFLFNTKQDIRDDDSPLVIITGTKSALYEEAKKQRSLENHLKKVIIFLK